jgi:hypothetical protein
MHRVACRQCRQSLAAALVRVQQQQQQQQQQTQQQQQQHTELAVSSGSACSFLLAGVPWRLSASGKSGSMLLVATAAPSLEVLRGLVCGGGSGGGPHSAPVRAPLPPLPTLPNLLHATPPAARVELLEDIKSRLTAAMRSLAIARHTLRSMAECVAAAARARTPRALPL